MAHSIDESLLLLVLTHLLAGIGHPHHLVFLLAVAQTTDSVMLCKELDLISEVHIHTILPYPYNLFTYSNVSDSFNIEHSEILEYHQFVKTGGCLILFLSLQLV